jgi:hypothetical protein
MDAMPREFSEEVADAAKSRLPGKLALLEQESRGLPWEREAAALIAREKAGLARATPASESRGRTLRFTGHQIDAPDRNEPRFPAEKEPIARNAIREAVEREVAGDGNATGIAGAASGGDILFLEVCAELGIPTRLYLALPPDSYVKESVAPAGGDWISRFEAIRLRFSSPPVLAATTELPDWLRHRDDYSIWQRNNLWMLYEALARGPENVTLIALWNGKTGDGPGGTADMIDIARARGAAVRILDTNALFGLAPAGAPAKP